MVYGTDGSHFYFQKILFYFYWSTNFHRDYFDRKKPFTGRLSPLCLLHPPCPNTVCPHGPRLFGKGVGGSGKGLELAGPIWEPSPYPWVPGMCEKPRQLRWRRKAPAFWAQGNGSLSLLLLSILMWLRQAAMNSQELSSQPPGSCGASPAPLWLKYLSCAEQSPLSSQLVQPRAVPGTALQNSCTLFPFLFCSTLGSLLSCTTPKSYFRVVHKWPQRNTWAPTANFSTDSLNNIVSRRYQPASN